MGGCQHGLRGIGGGDEREALDVAEVKRTVSDLEVAVKVGASSLHRGLKWTVAKRWAAVAKVANERDDGKREARGDYKARWFGGAVTSASLDRSGAPRQGKRLLPSRDVLSTRLPSVVGAFVPPSILLRTRLGLAKQRLTHIFRC